MSQFKKQSQELRTRTQARFFIGLTAALSMTLVGFEWKTYDGVPTHADEFVTITGPVVMIDPIAPTKRAKPKTIKNTTVIDLIKVIEDTPYLPEKEAEMDKDLPKIDTKEIFFGEEDEGLLDEYPITIDGPVSFFDLQQKPHFPECATYEKGYQRDQCTASAIKRKVVDKAKFPKLSQEIGEEGIVKVGFVIDENGQVSDLRIVRSVSPALDKAAMASIAQLPTFIPGKVGDIHVKVYYEMPVSFKLRN